MGLRPLARPRGAGLIVSDTTSPTDVHVAIVRKPDRPEYFDVEGNVTEMIRYREENGEKTEYDHWWFDKGMPERRIGRRPARWITSETPVMYLRCGDQWVQQTYVGAHPHEAEITASEFYQC